MTCPVIWVVIPAAGIGSRMCSERPKQYLLLDQTPIIEHSLNLFLDNERIAGVMVALADYDQWWTLPNHPRLHRCSGGTERSDSVANGLAALEACGAAADDWVLVHDAARPLLSDQDVSQLLAYIDSSQSENDCMLLATPVADTLKMATQGSDLISHTVNRDRLWRALTPQGARLGLLSHALKTAAANHTFITDEASALESIGLRPRLISADPSNIKITLPNDLTVAEAIICYRGKDARL